MRRCARHSTPEQGKAALEVIEEFVALSGPGLRAIAGPRFFGWMNWSRNRHVIGKAKATRGDANPFFVVTSLKPRAVDAQQPLRADLSRALRWETESKKCRLDLFTIALRPPPCVPASFTSGSPPRLCAAQRLAPHRPGADPVR
jgi:hypothetical protein